jgi:hypothetical protein
MSDRVMKKIKDIYHNSRCPLFEEEALNKDHINISKMSDKLGRFLSPGHFSMFDTVIGEVNSVRTAVDYVTIKDYPKKFLTLKRLQRHHIDKIPSNTNILKNENAVLAYFVFMKIMSNDDIKKELIDKKDLPIYSYNKTTNSFYGKKGVKIEINHYNSTLIRIINVIRILLVEEVYTDDMLEMLLNLTMVDDTVNVFEGSDKYIFLD